jgi:ribosomal protein S18 acetylase RimI-like enzyme
MKISLIEETPASLPEYEKISIAFTVETYFRVELSEKGLGGIRLVEEKAEKPFVKDYDAYPEERPTRWAERFDLSNWGILSAFDGEQRIGGAAMAWNAPEILMLEGRSDLACLWDLRVSKEYRGAGVGRALFSSALAWAKKRNCRQVKVETQNVNVPACKFYVRQGCELGSINRYVYPASMNEIQLIWYRKI